MTPAALLPRVLDSLMITGFVAGMMLLVEYANVYSRGRWTRRLAASGRMQYLLAAFLGVTPGCLGAFGVVALYSHGVVSFGAVTAAMIATSGDESFVLLALSPPTAFVLMALLFLLAVLTGWFTDWLSRRRAVAWPACASLVIHPADAPPALSWTAFRAQWADCSAVRGLLSAALAAFIAAAAAGRIGPPAWDWVRATLLAVSTLALAAVATAPDHFLEEHLWRHVVRKHVLRIFLWTTGVLLLVEPAERLFHADAGAGSPWLLLVLACAVGLIPESGPHLIFVTLYLRGTIPFGVLLASSIVQDGHGMLPLLAHSRRAFLAIKAVNFLLGLLAGAAAILLLPWRPV